MTVADTTMIRLNPRSAELRGLRGQFRRDLKDSDTRRQSLLMVALFVEDPPWWLEGMTVGDLLLSCRKVGRRLTMEICGEASANPLKLIRELPPGRRARLAEVIRDVAHRTPR